MVPLAAICIHYSDLGTPLKKYLSGGDPTEMTRSPPQNLAYMWANLPIPEALVRTMSMRCNPSCKLIKLNTT